MSSGPVPNPLQSAFDRVFPTKELFQGYARSAIIWSTCATILLAATLFVAYFIADLLDTRGVAGSSWRERSR